MPGDQRLVGYWISSGPRQSSAQLRDALRASLPEFMVPSAFVELARFPMTPNGKIDRKALPAVEAAAPHERAEIIAPEGELEQTIANVWKKVLLLDAVGVDDNFFDLGGHSLLVVQAHRMLRELCARPVSLTDLYRFPTIRGLAGYLEAEGPPGEAVKDSVARGEKRRQALGGRRRRR
jgi:hypothetical protein